MRLCGNPRFVDLLILHKQIQQLHTRSTCLPALRTFPQYDSHIGN
jgi:hypothetical protein